MNKPAAIYARVSSDRQKENHTIASQTAALIEYAQKNGYSVPPEWVFQDEGYSGAILVRPGLERLRDLAAEGQIAAVLVYSPDRLSRKYAYQVLLSEELSRCGVELIFLKAPAGATPEDQLLVQFQGMIAEYERAQIAERCRRGKKHMAQQGGVNVLSGAPFGYRYMKKSDTSVAFYEVIEAEAKVVRMVFEIYTQQRLSINAIARLLNERQIATRTGKGRWERSTVWGMLRNPAYRGAACYGKTEQRPRQRVTRPLRQRKALPSRDVGGHERPRAEWIEIAVPALVSEEMFALAQEQLEKNKHHSPRRTMEPTLLQGILVCEQCGYGLYRTSTHTSKHKLNYYRCLGSDGYRRLNGPHCTNRPIRQDYLDQFVWTEIIRLLDDPGLIQAEIDRRREAARNADPLRKREEELRHEQVRVEKSSERLVTAYQEGLVTLPQLRQRMPALQKQTQAVEAELQSLKMAAVDEAKYLQLAESLAGFRSKLRVRAEVLDIAVRQQILRLLVKEVLVGVDTITLRHSIPIPQSGPGSNGSQVPPSGVTGSRPNQGYLLRSGSHGPSLRHDSGNQRNQVQHVPAVQRNLCNRPTFHHLSEGSAFSLQQRRGSRDFHRLAHIAHLHRDVNAGCGLHFHRDAFPGVMLESGRLNIQAVCARKQIDEPVNAVGFRVDRPGLAGSAVGHGDLCARHGRAGRIGSGPDDGSVESLTLERKHKSG